MSEQLDKRLNAYRDDLADAHLKGRVDANAFVDGEAAEISVHFADLHRKPDALSGIDTQILYGQSVTVFDRDNGWAWVQTNDDGYVGYVQEKTLGQQTGEKTHMVKAPRTFLYSKADLKSPRIGYRSIGSKLIITDETTTRGTDYLVLDTGDAVIKNHVIELGDWQSDPVCVAETLTHTPYLWGGSTGFGVDCSGLVALANRLCGKTVLRDSDMQADTLGDEIDFDLKGLKRGDLVFWSGHVGMMADSNMLLHANGNTMNVAKENLSDAVLRIGYLYGQPTMVRRP